MVRVWSYVRNKTDRDQTYKSWRLANQIVSCIPYGLQIAQGRVLTVPPAGILKVPVAEWADTLRRQPWAEEVAETEVLALTEALNDAALEVLRLAVQPPMPEVPEPGGVLEEETPVFEETLPEPTLAEQKPAPRKRTQRKRAKVI